MYNLPDCLPVEDAEEHDPHPSASLHDHLDELSPFSEVMAQHQTGSFSHEASPRAQHHAVTVTFCNRWIVPVRTIAALGIAWRFVNRERGRGGVRESGPSLRDSRDAGCSLEIGKFAPSRTESRDVAWIDSKFNSWSE